MLLLVFLIYFSCLRAVPGALENNRPIIGILTEEAGSWALPNTSQLLAASYVKFVESAGGRVVPVLINRTEEEYKRLFNSINGIVYPGGHVNVLSSAYTRTARIFYQLAIEAKKRGDHFPVWGTCLGFELLLYLTSSSLQLSWTNTSRTALPLTFTNDTKSSRMFKGFPAQLMAAMASQPLTEHSHKWSQGVEAFNTNMELKKFFKVLSTNTDGQTVFVSTLEAYDYPIYGTQWHPEKNAFEWEGRIIPHTELAVQVTFYFAQSLVNEARKSQHRFESEEEERNSLIYNYSPVYTALNHNFEQIYFI